MLKRLRESAKRGNVARGLLLMVIPALWCLCAYFGGLTFLENTFLDWRFRWRGERDAPVKVVYVDIDSQSISEIGGFPWSRSYFARTVSALVERAQVKAIGIDVLFSENGVPESIDWKKRVEGNRELARYLAKGPPIVVAASYAATIDRDVNGKLVYRQLPRVRERKADQPMEPPELPSFRIGENTAKQWSPAKIGLIDTIDGGTRTVPAYAPTDIRPYFHMSIELAALYLGVPAEGIQVGKDDIELRQDTKVIRRIPLSGGQLLDVNWFSPWLSQKNPRVAFSTVYNYAEMLTSENGEEKKSAEAFFAQPDFKDAVVLIGPVDPLLQDLGPTPFEATPTPKVGIHGNLLKMILSERYLRRLPALGDFRGFDYLLTLGLSAMVTALATAGGARSVGTKLSAGIVLLGYVGFCFWIFSTNDFVFPIALPVAAALTTSFAAITWQLIREEKQKGRIKGMFGTYVSPQLVERLVESGKDPQLGGHESEITAYFSDIQAFSAFSEKLPSGPLVELMNEYLTACTDIVQEEGGTLDKYIGDAVVAMFGAPIALEDHAYRACVASQRVHRRIAELREKWKGEGSKWPPIVWQMQSRIGLNSGLATIGNMGSRTRFNYTMMGDNVNLAARMESGAKAYGVYTMVSETTKLACEKFGRETLVFRYLDRIVVKGRTQPVGVYEIVGLREYVSDEAVEGIQIFETGLNAYFERDWDAALAAFERSSALEIHRPGEDVSAELNPSLVLSHRCRMLRSNPPPPDWNGVFTMREK